MMLILLAQTTCLIVVSILVAWALFRKLPASRHMVLLATIISCVILPVLFLVEGAWGVALARVQVPAQTRQVVAAQPLSRSALTPDDVIDYFESTLPTSKGGQQAPVPSSPASPWPLLFGIVWGGGSVLCLVRFLFGSIRLRAICQRATEEASGKLARATSDVVAKIGVRRFPKVLVSEEISSPIAVALNRGTILIPRGLLQGSGQHEIEAILCHEYSHLEQKHGFSVLMERLFCAMYWPNPLAHLMCRQLCRSREEVCDNFVLELTPAPAFARTLLAVAQGCPCTTHHYPAAAGLLLPEWNLEQRVRGLLDPARIRETHISRSKMTVLNLSAATACLLIAGVQVTHAQDALVEIRQGGKTYFLRPTKTSPVTVKVTRGGKSSTELRIGPRGLGEQHPNPPHVHIKYVQRKDAGGHLQMFSKPSDIEIVQPPLPLTPDAGDMAIPPLPAPPATRIPGHPDNMFTPPQPDTAPRALPEELSENIFVPAEGPQDLDKLREEVKMLQVPPLSEEQLRALRERSGVWTKSLRDKVQSENKFRILRKHQGSDFQFMYSPDAPVDAQKKVQLERMLQGRDKNAKDLQWKVYGFEKKHGDFTFVQPWRPGAAFPKAWTQTREHGFSFKVQDEKSLSDLLARARDKALKENKPDVAGAIQKAMDRLSPEHEDGGK